MDNWKALSFGQKIIRIVGMAIGGMALAILIGAIFSVAVVYIWNGVMPELFGFPTITYLQAFLLIVLSRLFFGGIGGHRHHHHPGMHGRFGRRAFRGAHFLHHDMDWERYADYWDERGKSDFEEWLKEKERSKGS